MDTQQMTRVFKALSNPNRLQLYLQIAKAHEASFNGSCDCMLSDIIGRLKIGAPTISHHIKELSAAGLITTERNGKFLVCRVNKKLAEEAAKVLALQNTEK